MIQRLYWVLKAMLLTLLNHKFGRNWRKIQIIENNDTTRIVPRIFCNSFYFKKGIPGSKQEILLRNDVFRKYILAKNYIKDKYNLDLIIYDGYRPYEVQEYLFWSYMRDFTLKKYQDHLNQIFGFLIGITDVFDFKEQFEKIIPDKTKEILFEANRQYVSLPCRDSSPSPHLTGGAIDVWLYKNGKPLNLGCEFDHMEKDAGAFYYIFHPFKGYISGASKNRNIIIEAMTRFGFAAYGPEFWHYSYGDQMWALVYGKKNAVYSSIKI